MAQMYANKAALDPIPVTCNPEGALHASGAFTALTLLSTTTIITTSGVTGAVVTGLGSYREAGVYLTTSSLSVSAGCTVNIYAQTSADLGTTWDDIIAFTAIGSASTTETRVAYLTTAGTTGVGDRAVSHKTLTAGTIRPISFNDRMRIVATAVGGAYWIGNTMAFDVKAAFK